MSDVSQAPTGASRGVEAARPGDLGPTEGHGWVTFAGVMILIVGVLNVIYGIAAIDNANFYVADARYVISDLATWGWIQLIVGAVQVIAAFAIWRGSEFGRWIGIGSASVNAIVQLLFLPSYPFLSLALFAVNILVIYGLVAYGGRRQAV
jgi:hypothetical protein